ncbi:MAG: hypothetical protein ACYS6W_15925 [Planctomycetota bacterium]|jgi:hypothetical protein
MSFTPDEIKNIEIIVEGIQKVIQVISQQLGQFVYDQSTKTHRLLEGKTVEKICHDVYIASTLYLTVSTPPSNLIENILRKIYWDKPQIAKDLEEAYYRFINDVSKLSMIEDADNLYDELFSLHYNLNDLASTLETGAEIAKAEAEKPAKTEQDTTPAVQRGIITCLKKVVEKAWQIFTKSFWESVLERVWPK